MPRNTQHPSSFLQLHIAFMLSPFPTYHEKSARFYSFYHQKSVKNMVVITKKVFYGLCHGCCFPSSICCKTHSTRIPLFNSKRCIRNAVSARLQTFKQSQMIPRQLSMWRLRNCISRLCIDQSHHVLWIIHCPFLPLPSRLMTPHCFNWRKILSALRVVM